MFVVNRCVSRLRWNVGGRSSAQQLRLAHILQWLQLPTSWLVGRRLLLEVVSKERTTIVLRMLHAVRPVLVLLRVRQLRLTVLLVLPLMQHHVLVTAHLRVVMKPRRSLPCRLLTRYRLHHYL